VRSISGNIGIGGGNATTGPWDGIYKHTIKVGEMIFPGPAETWVHLDEHPDSMNDAGFFNPHINAFVDLPASYHNGAGGFSFADGHAEVHKWRGAVLKAKIRTAALVLPPTTTGDVDIDWMSYRGGRRTERYFQKR
jgi:prepilin-type processing-associated H-X9-DG protein